MSESRRPKARHPASRIALIVLAAVVVAIAAAWISLVIAFPPARLRALIQRQLASSLARDVRFDDGRIGLWPPIRVTVAKPELAAPGGFERGTMMRARSIHLDLDAFALLSNRMVVKRLVLDRPELHLVLRADGTTNLDGIGREAGAKTARKPMNLSVREFAIQDGKLLVDDFKTARRVALDVGTRWSLDLKGGARFRTHGETVVAHVAFGPLTAARPRDLNRTFERLRWQIEHRGTFDSEQKRLALETLALRFGRTSVTLVGLVQDPGPRPYLELRARGSRVDLGEILGFLAASEGRLLHGIRGDGTLEFDLAIRGTLGGTATTAVPGESRLPDVVGQLGLANASLQLPGAAGRIEALSLIARFAPDSIGIAQMVARVAGQPVRGSMSMTQFRDPRVGFAVKGNLELAAVAPLFVPEGATLAGRAAVDLRGRGRARDPGAMAIDGRAQLANVRVRHPRLPQEIENLAGTIQFSQTRASIEGLTAKAGGSSLALDARIERPLALMSRPGPSRPAPAEIQFDFSSRYLDLADVQPAQSGATVLPYATGSGRIAIAKFKNGKLEMEGLTADVTLDPTGVAAPRFAGHIYDGRVSGSARFSLRDTAHPRIAVNARLDSARVERLLGAWVPPGDWLKGGLGTTIDLDADLSDLRRSLTAAGLATVWNGSFGHAPVLDRLAAFTRMPAFKDVTFQDLRSSVRVQNGRVFTGPATMSGRHGDWQLSGSTGLDGTLDYAVSVTVPPARVDQLGARAALAAGALADDRGRVLLDFRVTGPAKSPKIAWDPDAMQARLAGRVNDALVEQKEKFERAARDTVEKQIAAAQDSAKAALERYRKAVEDSLRRKGRDLLEGFFGRGGSDTTK